MDITQLTAAELASLKQQLGVITDTSGRTPENRPRQRHDLRLMPTAEDPCPTFFWSAEAPRNAIDLTKGHPYPRLLWTTDGVEITVINKLDHDRRLAEGYLEVAPASVVIDPMVALREEFEHLDPADRELLLEAQKQQRLKALQSKLAGLTEADLEALLAAVPSEQVKRGPGRPRKEQVA